MDKKPAAMASLLTIQELAETLKVSIRTVETLIREQRAPCFIRVGRSRRWRTEDVEAWLTKQIGSTNS